MERFLSQLCASFLANTISSLFGIKLFTKSEVINMHEYTLEIKQIVDYPRCRIYRQFVQSLIADRSIRVSGGSGLFYFVVLCAYANFRTSYKRIDGISYTIYPGEWISLWRNCPGISEHASAARPWPLWRDCKRKGLSVFLFSDMVAGQIQDSRLAASQHDSRLQCALSEG